MKKFPQILLPDEVTGAGVNIYHPVGADERADAAQNQHTLGEILGEWAEHADHGEEITLRVERLTAAEIAALPEA